MTSATNVAHGSNQAVAVAEDEMEAALLDLVGDLAAYRPTGKVLIFEGGGDRDFDVSVVRRLFPDLGAHANLISGGSKGRVRDLYRALQRLAEQTGLADRYFAITDRDSETQVDDLPEGHVLSWDVYHIENYLLDPEFVFRAYAAVVATPVLDGPAATADALKRVAERSISRVVLVQLQERVNNELMESISIGAAPDTPTPARDLLPSIEASLDQVTALRASVGNAAILDEWATSYTEELRATIADGNWLGHFPGRTILHAFVNEYLGGAVTYDGFVNLIVNQMVAVGHQPAAMSAVLARVTATHPRPEV